jgi:hypothetical protein
MHHAKIKIRINVTIKQNDSLKGVALWCHFLSGTENCCASLTWLAPHLRKDQSKVVVLKVWSADLRGNARLILSSCYKLETNYLTPWNWALLEKPPVAEATQELPKLYETRRFITVFTRALHWFLPSARSVQSISLYPGSRWTILTLL